MRHSNSPVRLDGAENHRSFDIVLSKMVGLLSKARRLSTWVKRGDERQEVAGVQACIPIVQRAHLTFLQTPHGGSWIAICQSSNSDHGSCAESTEKIPTSANLRCSNDAEHVGLAV